MTGRSSSLALTTSGARDTIAVSPDGQYSICIWGSDPSSSASSMSPHPLKLLDTIATGHRSNIFSAKFLPNTSTPTIVSCAGDSVVRVFEVERLDRPEQATGRSTRNELYGVDGPG